MVLVQLLGKRSLQTRASAKLHHRKCQPTRWFPSKLVWQTPHGKSLSYKIQLYTVSMDGVCIITSKRKETTPVKCADTYKRLSLYLCGPFFMVPIRHGSFKSSRSSSNSLFLFLLYYWVYFPVFLFLPLSRRDWRQQRQRANWSRFISPRSKSLHFTFQYSHIDIVAARW